MTIWILSFSSTTNMMLIFLFNDSHELLGADQLSIISVFSDGIFCCNVDTVFPWSFIQHHSFIRTSLAFSFVPVPHYFCTQINGIDWAFIFLKFLFIKFYSSYENSIMWYFSEVSHLKNKKMHIFHWQCKFLEEIEQESIPCILTLFSAALYRCTRCPCWSDNDVYLQVKYWLMVYNCPSQYSKLLLQSTHRK